jgi:hypothetical protein
MQKCREQRGGTQGTYSENRTIPPCKGLLELGYNNFSNPPTFSGPTVRIAVLARSGEHPSRFAGSYVLIVIAGSA